MIYTNEILTMPKMIEAYHLGDCQYKEEIYQAGYDLSYEIVNHKLNDSNLANDIAINTMQDVMNNMKKISKAETYYKYVASTTEKQIENYLIFEGYQNDISLEEIYEQDCPNEIEMSYSPIDDCNQDLRIKMMRQAINELDFLGRSVLLLYYYKENAIEEIAKKLNLSHSKTSQILFSSMNEIREKILEKQKIEDLKFN